VASSLASFTLYNLPDGSNKERQVTVDPRKVLYVHDTIHGSVLIGYPGKQSFEVEDTHENVVKLINEGRQS